jgi:hypothetical protein
VFPSLGSGLLRVKPYIKFLIVLMWMTWGNLIWGSVLPALYCLTDKVGGPRVQVSYNRETNLRKVTA